MRTQQEIVDRITEVTPSDWLGAQQTDLIGALDYEHAKPYLKPDVTPEFWDSQRDSTEEKIREAAIEYLAFAVSKAVGHRGISASRTVDHYRAWLWLLELNEGFEDIEFAQYGAPMIAEAAKRLGVDVPLAEDEREMFERMAQGQACDPAGCYEGCGG